MTSPYLNVGTYKIFIAVEVNLLLSLVEFKFIFLYGPYQQLGFKYRYKLKRTFTNISKQILK